ncbi:MAG: hypothetical protein JW801_09335, partial [Bacteroidales bacterium]|nr:hypothetical protein [Bacteroidales bacterium]
MPLISRLNRVLLVLSFIFLGTSGKLLASPNSSLFDNYSVGNGLTDKTIHCIFQDSKGWIWIGTDFGLSRFDSYAFNKFEFNSATGKALSNALIRTIIEDRSGNIWIGTEGQGLFKYDRRYYKIEQYKDKNLTNNSVWSIIEYGNKLWVGTENGITCFDPKEGKAILKITSDTYPGLLSGSVVRKLLVDQDKRIWAGTENGVTVLNPDLSVWKYYRELSNDLTGRDNEVWEIFRDSEQNIWVGTYLGGLYKIIADNQVARQVIFDTDNNRAYTVRSVTEDKDGNIWIGTRGGLYTLDKASGKATHFRENISDDYSLVHNSVLNLHFDA